MVIRKYKFDYNDGYIVCCRPPMENESPEFEGQMAFFPEVLDSFGYGGYYKFINGAFVLDEERKALKIKEYEERMNENK